MESYDRLIVSAPKGKKKHPSYDQIIFIVIPF